MIASYNILNSNLYCFANSADADQLASRRVNTVLLLFMFTHTNTVKPVLSGKLKVDINNFLMENCSLMKVESIAECCPLGILQYF